MSSDPRWHRAIVVDGISINAAGTDVASFALPSGIARNRPLKLTIFNTSTTLVASIATLGLFTGAGGTGTTIVTAALITTLTAAGKTFDMTMALPNDWQSVTTYFLRNVIAHGSAATVSAALSWDFLG